MRIPSINPPGTLRRFYWALIMLMALGGCAVSLVAPYDAATFEEILKVSKKVDRFYGDLLEAPEKRLYLKYAEKYVEIETELRSLHLRNQARPLNQESTRIVEIMLEHWVAYKKLHRGSNNYPTARAELHRQRFTRLFVAAADAERAKKLAPEDREAKDTM
jgi:hypothetical protein